MLLVLPGPGVTESWGSDEVSDSEFNIAGFDLFRADRGNGHHGSGVLLFVNSNMKAVEVKLSNKFSDQIWCRIEVRNGENFFDRSLLPLTQC